METNNRKNLIQSVDRALDILNILSRSKPSLSAVEISKMTGINRTTTYGILGTLEHKGYITKDNDGRYSIGLKLYEVGSSYTRSLPLLNHAASYISNLTDKYQVSVHVGLRNEIDKIMIISASVPLKKEKINDSLPLPIFASGIGKVILAFQSEEEIMRIVETINFYPFTASTITNKEDFLRELEEIRKNGYSYDRGEYFDNTYCIAFPIRDFTNKVIAAISLSGPREEIEKKKEAMIPDGLQSSKYLSLELGYNPL